MTFKAPGHEGNLKQVMDAFDKYCNPKKNETVERYKFFSHFQNPGELLEESITDVKQLVIPNLLQRDLICRLHYAHSGVVSSLLRARECIYWPGMSSEIK